MNDLGFERSTILRKLSSLGHFFDFLVTENILKDINFSFTRKHELIKDVNFSINKEDVWKETNETFYDKIRGQRIVRGYGTTQSREMAT